MSVLAGAAFFALWRRVVKCAGGASAIPLIWRLVPERWRKPAQEKLDKQVDKIGK